MKITAMTEIQQEAKTAIDMKIINVNNTAIITVTNNSISRHKKGQDQPLNLVTLRFMKEEAILSNQKFRMEAGLKDRPTLKTIITLNFITKTCR